MALIGKKINSDCVHLVNMVDNDALIKRTNTYELETNAKIAKLSAKSQELK